MKLELRGDYSQPERKGAQDRFNDEFRMAHDSIDADDEMLEEYYESHPLTQAPRYDAEENARQACKRAKFVDFLATMSKLTAKIGENHCKHVLFLTHCITVHPGFCSSTLVFHFCQ